MEVSDKVKLDNLQIPRIIAVVETALQQPNNFGDYSTWAREPRGAKDECVIQAHVPVLAISATSNQHRNSTHCLRSECIETAAFELAGNILIPKTPRRFDSFQHGIEVCKRQAAHE